MINIEGKLNGYDFKVKPESLAGLKLEKELQQEMKQWQENNNKEFIDFTKKYDKELAKRDFDSIPDIPESKDWRFDKEFRSKRWKKMADACMDFSEKPPAKFWESEDIEYGVINMAWEYFLGKREIPRNMSLR